MISAPPSTNTSGPRIERSTDSTRDDRAGAQHAVADPRRGAIRAVAELGRGQRELQAVDRPLVVVEVEGRHRQEQVHVGLVVGVDRADVAPVAPLVLELAGDLVGGEVVEVRDPGLGEGRDHVAADVGRDRRVGRGDDVDEHVRGEHVVPHRGQGPGVVARHRWRRGRLLVEVQDAAVVGRLDDAELGAFVERHRDGRDRHAGPRLEVGLDHLAGVHVVDVVGAEHADEVGLLVADEVQVLVDGVGRAAEPLRPPAHLGRHRRDVVAEHRRQPPALGEVAVEAVALVLREHDDLEVAGVGEVRQHEVDEPVRAAERHGRLGPVGGERRQPAALTAGQHQREHLGFGGAASVRHQVVSSRVAAGGRDPTRRS